MKRVFLLLPVMLMLGCPESGQAPFDAGGRPPGDAGPLGPDSRVPPEGFVIGPAGGAVSAGTVEISVPEGAVKSEVTVTVSEGSDHPPGNIGPVFDLDAGGVTFDSPATLTVYLAPSSVPAEYQYEDLDLAFVEGGEWQPLTNSVADADAGTVSASTNHLSTWGVIPNPPPIPEGPLKLDLLFVVDNSASMCQEQPALGKTFHLLIEGLQAYMQVDARVAVTTTEAMSNAGQFVNTPATAFPPAAMASEPWPCLGNEDCVKQFGDGWECKGYPAYQLYNLNGSVNSTCKFACDGSASCCQQFCYEDECGDDLACLDGMCVDAPTSECAFECVAPGGSGSGCIQQPDTADCPVSSPPVLTLNNIGLFKCIATVESDQSYMASMEQGLKAAWLALNHEGPNADQASGFLRADAHLLIVFVTDEDDCSIDDNFCSPNWLCQADADCPAGSTCKLDTYFSQLQGKEMRLCCGTIKKDYYNICSLLGEHQGEDHHAAVYDLAVVDCSSDEDCPDGWYCKQGKKCRPSIFSLTNIASYQQPPGTPIFSLGAVADYYARFKSLKEDPAQVMVAAIVGDGMVAKDDKAAFISDECLENEKLKKCQEYAEAQAASPDCAGAPGAAGCEEFIEAKGDCIEDCYFASKGDANNGTVSKNTYVCAGEYGKADLGLRYVRLAGMFGPNGMVSNICAPEGMKEAMEGIAGMVVKVHP